MAKTLTLEQLDRELGEVLELMGARITAKEMRGSEFFFCLYRGILVASKSEQVRDEALWLIKMWTELSTLRINDA